MGHSTASQKAIKICDHLFPLLCLIHLSGEWFCPYPPKATNLFSCLSPCIRINLWNSQTCSLSLLPLSLLLSLSLVGSTSFPDLFPFISPLTHSHSLWLRQCLLVLTFPFPSLPSTCSSSLGVRNVCTNSIQIISRKERATRLCQWQFNPWWARCMQCCACSRKLSDCIWICADLSAARLLREENYTERDTWLIFHNVL